MYGFFFQYRILTSIRQDSWIGRTFDEYIHKKDLITFNSVHGGSKVQEMETDGKQMSLCMRKPTIWVPTRSDTNRAVQTEKMIIGWKFWI